MIVEDGKYVVNVQESPFRTKKYAFYLPPERNEYFARLLRNLGAKP